MSAQKKLLRPTTTSTSPVTKRVVYPYAVVNPKSRAENVVAIVERVVHAPLPAGYREIDEVIRHHEASPARAAAVARARERLAGQVESMTKGPTLSTLRLRAGLSQTKVAEILGNSQSSYSLIESGRRSDILLSTFEKLAEILRVSRDELAAALKNTQEKSS